MPYRYVTSPDASVDSVLNAVEARPQSVLKDKAMAVRIALLPDLPHDGYRYAGEKPLWWHCARPIVRLDGRWTVMDGIRNPRLEGPIESWPEQLRLLGFAPSPKGFSRTNGATAKG